MARRPGLIKRALIAHENRTTQSFFSATAIQQASAAFEQAQTQAIEAAKAGATPEQLQPFRALASAAAVEAGDLINTAVGEARRRGLTVTQPQIQQAHIDRKIAAFDAAVSAARPNPQAAGERAGQQSLAQKEAELGRPLTDEERAQLADVKPDASEGPFGGTSLRAQSANVVLQIANKFRKGETLTDDEKDQYALAYAELNAPRMVGSAQTGFEFVESRPDPRFPKPEQLGATPIPGAEPAERPGARVIEPRRPPEQAGRVAMMQSGLANARNVRDQIVRPDGSVNRELMTTMIFNVAGTEGRTVRAQFEDAVAAKLRLETGAAATPAEVQNILDRYLPKTLDADATVSDKLARLVTFFEQSLVATDPELFETLKARNPEIPDAPADEPGATFEKFDETTGFPIFKRPDGSRFMEAN
jgi:hypothetical protein